jgi:hypothetical protein
MRGVRMVPANCNSLGLREQNRLTTWQMNGEHVAALFFILLESPAVRLRQNGNPLYYV